MKNTEGLQKEVQDESKWEMLLDAAEIGVNNYIKMKSETLGEMEKKYIERALARNWSINTKDIHVEVSDNKVTLRGTVNSWYQKDESERIARSAPGVWAVENELVIDYDS